MISPVVTDPKLLEVVQEAMGKLPFNTMAVKINPTPEYIRWVISEAANEKR